MKYPKFLTPGDSIGLIAPSFASEDEKYQKSTKAAIRRFNKMGYPVSYQNSIFKNELPYLSNEPSLVAREFMENYLNDETKALISVGGGELEVLGLNGVDFNKLASANPKWFMGFSDNTNHCFLLLTLADTASIYGACAGNFGMYNWDPSIKDAFDLLTGEKLTLKGYPKYQIRHTAYQKNHPGAPYHLTEEKILTNYPSDKLNFSGRLIGGCLDILIMLCGTKYDHVKEFLDKYQEDGFIWFMEACDLNSLAYMRALIQLKEAGWFKGCKGFLIGRPQRAFNDDLFGINRFNALDILKDLNVPIVADFDLGHIKPTMPLILGSYATVDVNGNDISVKMELK